MIVTQAGMQEDGEDAADEDGEEEASKEREKKERQVESLSRFTR